MNAPAAINHHNAKALEIFRERAEARATLVSNGYLDLQTAVDELQEAAAAQGLVKRYDGQDEIQQILSDAFGRWRLANE
jgi:hypothetical protein